MKLFLFLILALALPFANVAWATSTKARAKVDLPYLKKRFGLRLSDRSVRVGDLSIVPNRTLGKLRDLLENRTNYISRDESYSVFYKGRLVSIVMSTQYKDWGYDFNNFLVSTDPADALLFNRKDRGPHALYDSLILALQKFGVEPRYSINEVHSIALKDFPVPSSIESARKLDYLVLEGVYTGPDLDANPYSYRTLEAAAHEMRSNPAIRKVLVLGSGAGYESVFLAKEFPKIQIASSEINSVALENTRLNLERHDLMSRSTLYHSDLFDRVPGKYDLIIFIPPRAVQWSKIEASTPPEMRRQLEDHRKYLLAHPEKFDLEGKLLQRTIQEFPQHLSASGKLLIMSDAELLPELASDATKLRKLYEGPWVKDRAEEGNYAVFELQPKE